MIGSGIILPNILGIIIIQERGIPMKTCRIKWNDRGIYFTLLKCGERVSNQIAACLAFRVWSWTRYLFRTPILSDMLLPLLKDRMWCDLQPFGHPNPLKRKVYGMVIRWSLATVTPSYSLIYAQDCRLISTTSPTLELSATQKLSCGLHIVIIKLAER